MRFPCVSMADWILSGAIAFIGGQSAFDFEVDFIRVYLRLNCFSFPCVSVAE